MNIQWLQVNKVLYWEKKWKQKAVSFAFPWEQSVLGWEYELLMTYPKQRIDIWCFRLSSSLWVPTSCFLLLQWIEDILTSLPFLNSSFSMDWSSTPALASRGNLFSVAMIQCPPSLNTLYCISWVPDFLEPWWRNLWFAYLCILFALYIWQL